MADSTYRAGVWFAAVGARAAVLVSDQVPHAGLEKLWQVMRSDGDVDAVLSALASADDGEAVTFGLVVSDGRRLWVHVRSGATVVVTDASGRERIIDSGGISTQVEYAAADVAMVTLGRSGAASGGPVLPISTGIVPADSLDWQPPSSEEAEPAPITPELFPAAFPLAAVPPAPAASPELPPPPPLHRRAPMIDALDPNGVPAPLDGAHDGFTIARSAVQAMRSDEATSQIATVQAVMCPQQHVNAPEATSCRSCGEAIEPQEPAALLRPTLGVLRFSTGQVVEVDRRIVVGRSPSVDRVAGEDLPQLVQVDSPDQDVSRSHAEVRVEGWHVLVVDLDSVNGTVVTVPGREPERLHALEPYPLVPGAVVDLAGEVTFTYEAAT